MTRRRQGSGGQARDSKGSGGQARRTFADVERTARSDERALERDGFRELIEQKKAGLRHAIGQGRIRAELASEVEHILVSMTDDVSAGLHRMDIIEGKK